MRRSHSLATHLAWVLGALAVAAAGCQKAQDSEKLDQINQKLDKVLSELEKGGGRGGPAAPTPPQRPPGPDPAKTYAIPLVENPHTKGPKDALVTIVESSDFQ